MNKGTAKDEHYPKAVIFDVDGLLVDSDDLTFVVVQDALRHDFNKRLTKHVFSQYFGLTRHYFTEAISEHYGLAKHERQLFAEIRNNLHYEAVQLKPGASALLTYLEANGVPMGLATNGVPGSLSAKIDHLEIKPFFQEIILANEVPHPKPEPDIYEAMAKRLMLSVHELLVLEDSQVGVEAAVAAGCDVYFVPNHYITNAIHIAREHDILLFTNLQAVLKHLQHLEK